MKNWYKELYTLINSKYRNRKNIHPLLEYIELLINNRTKPNYYGQDWEILLGKDLIELILRNKNTALLNIRNYEDNLIQEISKLIMKN